MESKKKLGKFTNIQFKQNNEVDKEHQDEPRRLQRRPRQNAEPPPNKTHYTPGTWVNALAHLGKELVSFNHTIRTEMTLVNAKSQ